MPGVPGPHGPQGRGGPKGQIGDKGSQGKPGPRGDRGREGPPGKSGPRGIQGMQGQQGLLGMKGERGAVGMKGERGAVGMKGERGIVGNPGRKGDKGEKGQSVKASQGSAVSQTNWKQCVWKSGIHTDNGKIKVNGIRIINSTLQRKFIPFLIKIFQRRTSPFSPIDFIGTVIICQHIASIAKLKFPFTPFLAG